MGAATLLSGFVLVVDASQDDAELTRRAVERAGVLNTCLCVATVNDAVEALHPDGNAVGLILLDSHRSGRGARRDLQHVLSEGRLAPFPVVILAGCELSEHLEIEPHLRVLGVLRKPLDVAALVLLLADHRFALRM